MKRKKIIPARIICKVVAMLCILLLATVNATSSTYLYTLKSTDTLDSVAQQSGATIEDLWALNSFLFVNKNEFLRVTSGKEIWLPQTKNKLQNNDNKPEAIADNGYLSRGAGLLTSGTSLKSTASSWARSYINSGVNSETQKWLSQFGSARTSLGLDNHGKVDGSLDVLIPLYQSADWMLFTQDGWRHKDSRHTINIGIGSRWFAADTLYGINGFIDNDITGHNYRVGVGGEYWTPYIRLSANGYQRLNGWHQSRDFSNYDERPANGYDAVANLILPAYPSLGMKLKFEQYYGDSVALFGRDNRQADPYAGTVGINWTPVPLVSLGAEWRHGQQGMHDTNVYLSFNYRIGESWQKQISPAAVAGMRSLAESRNDLVERNNNIILDYREQILITLALAHPVSGQAGSVQPLQTSVSAKNGLKTIEWNTPELTAQGGKVFADSNGNWQVLLPSYQSSGNNSYIIRGVAVDKQDNRSAAAETTATVLAPAVNAANSPCKVDPATLPANGSSTATLSCSLNDDDNQPVKGMASLIKVIVSAAGGDALMAKAVVEKATTVGKFSEDGQHPGHYSATVTAGTLAQQETLSPSVEQVKLVPVPLTLTPWQISAAHSHCQIAPAELSADGSSTATLSCELKDDKNDAIGGIATAIKVTITPDDGTTIAPFSEGQIGHYSATVTAGTVAGNKTLSPKVNEIALNDVSLQLNEQQVSAANSHCQIKPGSLLANGKSTAQLSCLVKDNNNHPIPGLASQISVSIPTGLGSKVDPFSEDSNQAGNYLAKVTAGTTDGTEILSPAVKGVALNNVALGLTTQQVSAANSSCHITPAQLAADGNSKAIMTCQLEDDDKAPITGLATGIQVTVAPDDGTVVGNFSEDQQQAGSYNATVTAGTVSGDKTLSPSANSITLLPVDLKLTPPVISADKSGCSVTPDTLPADGASLATMTCLLKDATGQPVGGQKDNLHVTVRPAADGSTVGAFTEDGPGSYRAIVTAGKAAGVNTLLPAVGNVVLAGVNLTLTHVYHVSTVTVAPDGPLAANGTDTYTYTATVKDEKDNLATNQQVSMEWRKSDSTSGLILQPQGTATDGAGQITATLTSTVVVSDVQVTAKTAQQATAVNADKRSFIPAGPIYNLTLTPNLTSPQPEGQAHTYIFTAKVTQKSDGKPVENVALVWTAIIPSALSTWTLDKDKHLHTTQTEKTDAQGEATYTLYSDQGGVDDLRVTVSVKKAHPGDPDISDPASADQTVSITGNEMSGIHSDQVVLTPYVSKGSTTATNSFIVNTSALQFSWKDIALVPNLTASEKADENGTGALELLSDHPAILRGTPYTGAAGGYYTIDDHGATGAVKLTAKVHLKTGRYKLYRTTMNIALNVFPGPAKQVLLPQPDPYAPGPGGPSTFLEITRPPSSCASGDAAQDEKLSASLTRLYSADARYNLRNAGLFGDPVSVSTYSHAATQYRNRDTNIGQYGQIFSRAWQIANPDTVTSYILLCTYNAQG